MTRPSTRHGSARWSFGSSCFQESGPPPRTLTDMQDQGALRTSAGPSFEIHCPVLMSKRMKQVICCILASTKPSEASRPLRGPSRRSQRRANERAARTCFPAEPLFVTGTGSGSNVPGTTYSHATIRTMHGAMHGACVHGCWCGTREPVWLMGVRWSGALHAAERAGPCRARAASMRRYILAAMPPENPKSRGARRGRERVPAAPNRRQKKWSYCAGIFPR